jgi:hypothetical protein
VSRDVLLRDAGAATERARPARTAVHATAAGPGAPATAAEDAAESPEWRRRGPDRRRATHQGAAAERALVTVMLHSRDRIEAIAERVGPEAFRDPVFRDPVYARLVGALVAAPDATLEELTRALTPAEVAVMQELLEEEAVLSDIERAVDDSLGTLRGRELREQLAALDRLYAVASDAEKDDLFAQKRRLNAELGALKGVGKRFGKSRR